MTKDVLISVTGVHTLDGDSGDVELITTGNYYEKNGVRYLLYDESMEGLDQPVKNVVKIRPDTMEIIKRGGVNVHMTFRRGVTVMASYVTPFGEMLVGITTERIRLEETDGMLCVRVEYILEINGQQVSRCHITLEARSRGNEEADA
ncbi:rho guanine nucleotide exchange factor [Lachnoclostridium sp. An14]|uniref:DUF1934 domain-containing protein n=1 Tax=Lachnoclostridium sp. An14 TaxID=1965562 RepID=UPI000B3AEA1D|nr:DUF1934 domain-containing protein [Lachnoclostridium sp. An14]OUQ20129.1 rho guanine nucleotide exchange factor [Lachnoclostridium sp. An14]